MVVTRYLTVIILAAFAVYYSQRLLFSVPKSSTAGLIPPPQYIEHLTFGYRELVADFLWLRVIQDFESCEIMRQGTSEFYNKEYVSPMQDILPKEDQKLLYALSTAPAPRKQCMKGWAFTMMDAVTNLSPRFRSPYILGAVALSVMLEDFDGATVIFDRGVKNYPKDWVIPYRAAYHYLFDRRDLTTSAKLMDMAVKNGAPHWLLSLSARLYTESGQAELGLIILRDYLKQVTNPVAIDELEKRIKVLEEKVKKSKPSP